MRHPHRSTIAAARYHNGAKFMRGRSHAETARLFTAGELEPADLSVQRRRSRSPPVGRRRPHTPIANPTGFRYDPKLRAVHAES